MKTPGAGHGMYSRAVFIWLILQILSSAVNSIWVEFTISPKNVIASIFISALVSAIQVLLTASLLWRMKPKHRATSVIAGAGIGFAIPMALYLLIGPLSWISDFFAFISWMLLRCSFSLLIVGMIGGACLGYARSRIA